MDKHPAGPDEADTADAAQRSCDEVDTSSFDSFPASDPPSWTPVAGTGTPSRDDETPSREESQ